MNTVSKRQKEFLRRATEIAKVVNNNSCWHFGAILAYKGRIISTGQNNPWRTHRRSNTHFRNIHAEFDALLGVQKEKLIGTTLYIVRLGYDLRSHWMMARPCPHCEFALRQAGIRDVYYSISDNVIGYWNLSQNKEVRIMKEAA